MRCHPHPLARSSHQLRERQRWVEPQLIRDERCLLCEESASCRCRVLRRRCRFFLALRLVPRPGSTLMVAAAVMDCAAPPAHVLGVGAASGVGTRRHAREGGPQPDGNARSRCWRRSLSFTEALDHSQHGNLNPNNPKERTTQRTVGVLTYPPVGDLTGVKRMRGLRAQNVLYGVHRGPARPRDDESAV